MSRPTLQCTAALALLWSAGAPLPARAEAPSATHKSGEIRGRVTYCAPGGASGAIVHLPGRSFQARLGPAGDFWLYWVPVGRHSVAIDAPGRATHIIEDVVVNDKRITDLAVISVCRDADQDSANEDVDCNDNNPNVRPGVAESCDGYDNNCDGTVDEGCVTCTDADHDGFFAQANCDGPIDCDDTHATTRPGAQEICDGLDNNCDSTTDEGFDLQSDPSVGDLCTILGCRDDQNHPVPGIKVFEVGAGITLLNEFKMFIISADLAVGKKEGVFFIAAVPRASSSSRAERGSPTTCCRRWEWCCRSSSCPPRSPAATTSSRPEWACPSSIR